MSGSDEQKVWITRYYITLWIGFCQSVDTLCGIYVNDKTVMEKDIELGMDLPFFNEGRFPVNMKNAFGGDEKEGGLIGWIYVYSGHRLQKIAGELVRKLPRKGMTSENCPAERGIFSMWFTGILGDGGFYFNANTATLPDIWSRVRRLPKLLGDATKAIPVQVDMTSEDAVNLFPRFGQGILSPGTEGVPIWDPETKTFKIVIIKTFLDANPAQILYETLVNRRWGMQADPATIDIESYRHAANVLFNEGFGISLVWSSEQKIEDFQTVVLNHIQATQFIDPVTGKFRLKLIRGDYDASQCLLLNKDNATMTRFSRKGLGETINEMKISWRNPKNEQDETVAVHDIGNIAEQGTIVTETRDMHGIRSSALALVVAQRECRAASAPLCSAEMWVNRDAWFLVPGDVVRVTWDEYGLLELPMRVMLVTKGTHDQSKIKLNLVEDVFALPLGHYVNPATTEHVSLNEWPRPADFVTVFTLPAYIAAAIDRNADESVAFAGLFAAQDSNDTARFDLLTETVSANGAVAFTPYGSHAIGSHGVLRDPLPGQAVSVVEGFDKVLGPGLRPSGFVMIGSGGDEAREICLVQGVSADGLVTLQRGCLDTIPRPWPKDTEVWFFTPDSSFFDKTARGVGTRARYKVLPTTSRDTLDETYAAVVETVVGERPHLPNRPANVSVGGARFNSLVVDTEDPIPVTWSVRNRTMEDGPVYAWTDAPMPPEPGQLTRIQVLTYTGRQVLASYEVEGNARDIDFSDFGDEGRVIVRVDSVRNGLESLQGFEVEVEIVNRTGWGYGWGESWGQ